MKIFAAIATVFFALVASSYALPTAEATAEALPAGYEPITRDEILRRLDTSSAASPFGKRTPGGIYLCTGSNYTGTCGYKVQPFNTCVKLTAPYLRNIGSFGPDQGALCRITTTANTCTTHGDLFIQYPGTSNLRDYHGGNYGAKITSFLCQECTSCR